MPRMRAHRSQFAHPVGPSAGRPRTGCFDKGFQLLRMLQKHATTRVLTHMLRKSGQKLRSLNQRANRALAHILHGELYGRTGLNIPGGVHMVADAHRRRAQGSPLVIPIRINHHQRYARAHVHDEPPQRHDLFCRQRQLRTWIRASRAINVVPQILNTKRHDIAHKGLGHYLLKIRLADTAGHPRDQAPIHTALHPGHAAMIHAVAPTTLIAGLFKPLNAHKRGDIAKATHLVRHRVCDQRPICEKLKIAVPMPAQQL